MLPMLPICLNLLSIWHLPVSKRKAIRYAFQPWVYFKRQRLHQAPSAIIVQLLVPGRRTLSIGCCW